jgi:GxxExxY protein
MYKQEGYTLVAAAIEVYNTLGPGFLEEVYQECLERELASRGIPFTPQPNLRISYKGAPIQKYYRPDLYAFDGIIVELKSIKFLTENEYAQLFNYLKATGKPVGYLFNFGNPQKLEWKRFIHTPTPPATASPP